MNLGLLCINPTANCFHRSIAEKHAKEQGFEIKQYKVPVVRLASVCEQHAHSDIHFLKIDVEGAEKLVLQGMNLKKTRPWIILVESTQPLTQIEKYEEWESILLESDYEYCYFDGLNRFYVAKEHHELKDALSIPPNVFDGFMFGGKGSSHVHQQISHIQNALAEKDNQRQRLESSLQQIEQQRQALQSQCETLQAEANQHEQILQQKEGKQRELLLSLLEKETKQQETNALLMENKHQLEQLQTELSNSHRQQTAIESSLQEIEQQRQALQSQCETLQAEANQHKQALQQKEAAITGLNSELATVKQEVEVLNQSNHQWWTMADQHSKSLIEADAKIDGLNQSSHHWWLESERLNKELNTVYHSKSWIITWPLRKLSQFVQWLFYLSIKLAIWLIRLPKRIARWILVKAIAYVLKHPELKERVMDGLQNHSGLEMKLRQLALSRGVVVAATNHVDNPALAQSMLTECRCESVQIEAPTQLLELEIQNKADVDLDPNISSLSPSTYRIYSELKTAMTQCHKEDC